jgi:hypothetical protein
MTNAKGIIGIHEHLEAPIGTRRHKIDRRQIIGVERTNTFTPLSQISTIPNLLALIFFP